MERIRILVVDDVAIVRRLVVDALSVDPDLQVVGSAGNGREALARIPQTRPDLVILDYEMPEMDGLETLKEIRKSHPGVKVIFFSSYTRQGAKVSLDALWQGADDYATKVTADNLAAATLCVQTELLPKIKALCPRGSAPMPEIRPAPVRAAEPSGGDAAGTAPAAARAARAEIVAIGASTGGPRALSVVIESLPTDFPVPIVVVQHMPPLFTRSLAERLSSRSGFRCAEAVDGGTVEAGTVLIAPGNWHLTVVRDGNDVRTRLTADPPENSCRPSVDPLFRSVAEAYGPGALALLLTGMGQDGLAGARAIRERQGRVLVQDEASSVVWGMPGSVARAGLATRIVPLPEISSEILKLVSPGARRRATVA